SPARTTCDLTTTPSPSRTLGPITENGPTSTPAPSSAPGSMMAEGWMRVSAILRRDVQHGGQRGLAGQLAIDGGAAFKAPDLAAGALDRQLHPQFVAGDDHAAK